MATEIPTQIRFQHLLSHTFPGFFSAITLFMLIDVWSPINLTSLAVKDLNSLATLAGFVLLIGTILGIILDGIHHTIIEDNVFDKLEGTRELIMIRNKWLYDCMGKKDFSTCGDNCIACKDYFKSGAKKNAL